MKLCRAARFFFLNILFFLSCCKTFAQLSADDSAFFQKAVNNTVAFYHQSLGDQSGLYNGIQHAGYPFVFETGDHPFFYSAAATTGAVVYNNIVYPNINLHYDEVADVLIFEDATHRIQLINERVSRFTIAENNFIRIVKDSLGESAISSGFYNLLYEGNTAAIKKEVKKIREEVRNNSEGVLRHIETKTYYYIKKKNEYYAVKRKKNVLGLLKDKKKEVQQYIKDNNLSFKNDRDNMLKKITAYYDQLTK
jgi:hypothetical protein